MHCYPILCLASILLLSSCGKTDKNHLIKGRLVEHFSSPFTILVGNDDFAIFQTREGRSSAVSFKNTEVPAILELLSKYRQLVEVSKTQGLAPGVNQPLASMAYCKAIFTTPDSLVFDAMHIDEITGRGNQSAYIDRYSQFFTPAECERLPEVLKLVPQWREEDALAGKKLDRA